MKCTICGKPLIKEGRTEHYLCRKFKRVKKRSINVIRLDSTDFNDACRAIDRNPDLINKLLK